MGPNSGSFTHQFANKRDGPLLAQLRHAVDAEGRVSTVRHRAKSSPLNETRFKHFTVESFQFWLFTDPGLAHACLLGSPSCSRFWNTESKVTGLAIRKPLNCTASMHTNWDEREVRKWAGFEIGWLSFCPARQRDLYNQSLWPLAMRAS